MNETELNALLYLVLIIGSLILTLGIGVYTFRRQNVTGVRPFGLVLLLEASWTLGIILELISINLEGKIFWDNI